MVFAGMPLLLIDLGIFSDSLGMGIGGGCMSYGVACLGCIVWRERCVMKSRRREGSIFGVALVCH